MESSLFKDNDKLFLEISLASEIERSIYCLLFFEIASTEQMHMIDSATKSSKYPYFITLSCEKI
jgi:hypothetical protein